METQIVEWLKEYWWAPVAASIVVGMLGTFVAKKQKEAAETPDPADDKRWAAVASILEWIKTILGAAKKK